MTPTSKPSRERHRAAVGRAVLTAALLACLGLLAPRSAGPLLADDEKPPSATDQAEKPAATPGPTPAPGAGQAPRPATVPAKPAAAAAKPAPPAPAPRQILRFDDFDLEKYHRPAPQDEDDEETEETGMEAAAGGTTSDAGTVPRARPKSRPKPVPEESAVDPLKPFRDREAKEKFRQMQIETGRQRLAKLQERLNYLNAKRDALTNPAPLLVGQSHVQNPPAKPGEPPPPPTPIQGPGRGLTAKPGPGKMPVGGLFPPIPPPQTDEDRENDKKLKVKDLLLQVEEEIKSVQEEIETAQNELAAVETRFAQESQSR